MSRLYDSARLFVNYFQPSFKLAEKQRDGAQVRKRYHMPASQQKLVEIADTPVATVAGSISPPTINQFLASLNTAWREGEANPTAKAKAKVPRSRRRPDGIGQSAD